MGILRGLGRPARAAGILTLVGTGWVCAQISPGSLSKAHHSLSGQTKCISCHSLATGGPGLKCLNCHVEIRERLAARHGLHATMVNPPLDQKECAHCHSEHNGERFVPIKWDVDLSEFDHSKTGYALEGGHRGLDCRKCHNAKHIAETARRKITVKDLNRTYLGLTTECQSCHGDVHRGQVTFECLKCHEMSKWKPASRFNHEQAKFQITGAHEKVVCQKCHEKTGEPQAYIKLTGLSYANCDGCHKDPHRAAFNLACKSCHSENAWKPAHLATEFDHSKAKFALEGKHVGLVCSKCHHSSDFKQPVAHARCLDCHQNEPHGKQLAARADGGECSSCHVVKGWKPATFNVAAHASTHFPLDGRHSTVPCAKCHPPQGQATVYRVRYSQCTDCHKDQHNEQFAGAPYANRCDSCHNLNGFQRSTFTLARHSSARMPLSGAHAAVPCGQCHYEEDGRRGQPGRFRFSDLTCAGCHEDPHKGQFRDRMLATRGEGGPEGCQTCHTLRTWRDVTKFDHSTARFRLAGTHRGVPCEKCHRPTDAAAGLKSAAFRSASSQCSGCHEDQHGGQFATASAGADCGKCHSSLQWKPAAFTHDRQTSFSLTEAHRGISCRECHTKTRQVNGKAMVVYRPAPRECGGCHGPEVIG